MVQWSKDAADRAARATREVERRVRNEPGQRGRWQGGPDGWVRFELTEDIVAGGEATAKILQWSAGGAGAFAAVAGAEDVTVRDATESWGPADSGTKGWYQLYWSKNGPVRVIMDLEICPQS